LLAFTKREEVENKTAFRNGLRILPGADDLSGSGVRIRQMGDVDLGRILELRSVVRWAADPNAFDVLRGVRDAHWAVAEAYDGAMAGFSAPCRSGGSASCVTSPSMTATAGWGWAL
jgi:hypothetical protein